MIYTVICDSKNRDFSSLIKADCRPVRQSIPSFTPEIREYIDKAKNSEVREERMTAYSTLLIALKTFFNIENPVIEREKGGKPRITSHDIFFNISHSDGLVAVTLSDTHEVGVDLQAEISREKEKRLEDRFLSEFSPIPHPLEISFFYSDGDTLCEVDIPTSNSLNFTDKWASYESVLKLFGGGFGNAGNAPDLAKTTKSDIRKIALDKIIFSLVNSIKNG